MGRAWRLERDAAGELTLTSSEIATAGTWVHWPHGLCDAHAHLGMEGLRLGPHGSLPGGRTPLRRGRPRLGRWLSHIVPLESARTADVCRRAAPALDVLAAQGVGVVQDFYAAGAAVMALAADRSMHVMPSVAWLAGRVTEGHTEHLRRVESMATHVARLGGRWMGIAAHQVEGMDETHRSLAVEALALARTAVPGAGFLTHWAETSGRPARGPGTLAWLDEAGLIDDATVLVHGVHATEPEIMLVAERGAHVVLCPGSNAWLRSGTAPVAWLDHAADRLLLGTDSSASGTALDLLKEAERARRWATPRLGAAAGRWVLGALTPPAAWTPAVTSTGGAWWRLDDPEPSHAPGPGPHLSCGPLARLSRPTGPAIGRLTNGSRGGLRWRGR